MLTMTNCVVARKHSLRREESSRRFDRADLGARMLAPYEARTCCNIHLECGEAGQLDVFGALLLDQNLEALAHTFGED